MFIIFLALFFNFSQLHAAPTSKNTTQVDRIVSDILRSCKIDETFFDNCADTLELDSTAEELVLCVNSLIDDGLGYDNYFASIMSGSELLSELCQRSVLKLRRLPGYDVCSQYPINGIYNFASCIKSRMNKK